jgi:hypothetical protein
MRRVQELLSNDSELKAADEDESFTPAAVALTSKRLTFAWLDGEAQKVSFFFSMMKKSYDWFMLCLGWVMWVIFT